jgi:hypothetical protein
MSFEKHRVQYTENTRKADKRSAIRRMWLLHTADDGAKKQVYGLNAIPDVRLYPPYIARRL